MDGDLYHHGIKGQRWGIRRFQKKDGSLTPAGKKRYSDDARSKESFTTKHYNKAYERYKAEGYTDKEADKMAKGQVKTEKILMAVGATAATVAVSVAAYKFYDNHADRMIKPGKLMQTVHEGSASERLNPGNPFFATYTKADHTIYASKVFTHFKDSSNVTRFYTDDGVKVASRTTGRKVFSDLMKSDPELKKFVESDSLLRKHTSNPKKLYDQFNKHLVLRGEDNDRIHGKFYEALKKRGYGAVMDINDSKLEGFTYNPVIVFDNQIKHITSSTKATPEQLGLGRMTKAAGLSTIRKTMNKPLSNPDVQLAAVMGGASTISSAMAANDYVKSYKKKHPNTNLTDWQLTTMYMNENQS